MSQGDCKMAVSGSFPTDELQREAERSNKLKLVLAKLLSPEFKLSDDTLVEKLFTILQNQFNERNDKWKASDLGMYVPWMLTAVKRWSSLRRCVKVLTLRLAGLASSLRPGLKALFETGLFASLRSMVKSDYPDWSVLLGYCECLYAVLINDPSCHYVLDLGLWRDMLEIAMHSGSLYTVRKGVRCIAYLSGVLTNRFSVDNTHLVLLDACFVYLRHGKNIIEVKSSPSHEPVFHTGPPAGDSSNLLSAIALAREIFSEMLDQKISMEKVSELVAHYRIKEWCWNIITEESENVEVINGCSRLLAVANATSIVKNENGEVEYRVMRSLTLDALSQLNLTAQKHMFTLILDICLDYQKLWAKHGGKVIYSEDDLQQDTWDLENNLIITQCMPLYICMKVTRVMESDVMDMFANKVFTLSCKETQRVCYMYRDCLREAPDRSLEALCLHAIRSFLRIPSCYTKREQAVMSFQCMMHTLKEFVPEEVNEISADCIVAKKSNENLVTRFPNILSAILDGLSQFITTFKITWQDSLETVCILSFIQTLAEKKDISPMLCAKALQLAKHVIAQFIPPNLALLVDTLKGSSMESLGGLIRRKMADIHWEVRDSALELLLAVTHIAKAKFPAFQSLLVEKELASLLVSLASTDPSSYVRVSSLTCLTHMVKIQHVWDTALFDKRLIDVALRTLMQDTEGIVRSEAALLINQIYFYQHIPNSQNERLFDVMSHVSQKDLYGDTRLACLEFWATVIEKTKSRQGMMDGEFPSIIFSAQKKKIITLDRSEIRSRLGQLLNDLSSTTCLQVLWTSVNDDCDLNVALKGKEMIEKLVQLLDKYDAIGHLTKMKHIHELYDKPADVNITFIQPPPEEPQSEDESEKRCGDVDQAIEEIVQCGDVELIERLAHCEVKETLEPPPRSVLPPLEFLNRVLTVDLGETEKRALWIRRTHTSLDSLLEDILCTNTTTNLIDCY